MYMYATLLIDFQYREELDTLLRSLLIIPDIFKIFQSIVSNH